MSDFDLLDLTAEQLTTKYRAGALSPVDVVEQSLARVEQLEPVLHAFYTVTPEIARADAEASAGRYRAGETIGPLDGVPYSIKDLEATKGIRTTLGSAVTKDWVPDYDTVTAERLRSSGGLLLGKTVAPHMGYKDSSENLIQEPTENPWKSGYNPGGSSSGAAASVAARYSPIAQGSDGAGSIRIPSALSGTVGFKASIGRVPVSPQRNYWGTTVHNGPITRSVRDAALMLDVLAGPDPRDPLSLYDLPHGGFLGSLDTLGEHERGRRIVLSTDFGYGWTSPAVSRAVQAAAALLESSGHHVDERVPGWENPAPTLATMWTSAFAAGYTKDLDEHPDLFEDSLRDIVVKGRTNTALDYLAHLAGRSRLSDQMSAFFETTEYLVAPTMPLPAWPLLTYPAWDGAPESSGLERAYLVNVFNFTGNPAITIPCGLTDDGLPIGVQVVGRMHDDVGVLRLAAELEGLIGFDARPTIVH